MPRVYIYVVDRDLGFAPNPFHGLCSLATCKPDIRSTAKVNDWIFGLGGSRLKATGRCIFAMKVTKKITFNEYWTDPEYEDKKPIRNGSKKMMVGDNIYFFDDKKSTWHQAHSHHSKKDGSVNEHNLKRDTKTNCVLLSDHYYYFGSSAPEIPPQLLTNIGYKNQVGHRVFDYNVANELVDWVESKHNNILNLVIADPFDFDKSEAHYSVDTNRLTK